MKDDCLWEKRQASVSVNTSLENHIQSRPLQLVAGSHWQGCMQQPMLPLAHLCETCHRAPGSSAPVVRQLERPICSIISHHKCECTILRTSQAGHHPLHWRIHLPGKGSKTHPAIIHETRCKGEVAFTYVHTAVVALENLSGP